MKAIKIPNFAAEQTKYTKQFYGQLYTNFNKGNNSLIPSLPKIKDGKSPTLSECRYECLDRCVSEGNDSNICDIKCSHACQYPSPYIKCFPAPAGFNYYASMIGIAAWEVACSAAGTALTGADASKPCHAIADQMRANTSVGNICYMNGHKIN